MNKLAILLIAIATFLSCNKEQSELITKPELSIYRSHSEMYALEMNHGYELLFYLQIDSLACSVINDLIKADITYDIIDRYDCEALYAALENIILLENAIENYVIVDLYHQDLFDKENVIRQYLISRGESLAQIRAYTIVALLPHETVEKLKFWIDKNYPILEHIASTSSSVGAF